MEHCQVLCARWCQPGNLKGSCRKGGFTAAASQQYLWLCHTSVLRPRLSRSVLQGLERLCLAQRGAAVTQLWLQPVQGFAKAHGPACSLNTDTSLRCRSCPSFDTHKERSVGQCKSPEELHQVQDFPFSLERPGQSPEMRLCCGNQQLAPLPFHLLTALCRTQQVTLC